MIAWISKNLGAILGIAQAIVKIGKEICTLLIDLLLSPFFPSSSFKVIVEKVRGWFNIIDSWLEKIKNGLLSVGI